jgi:sugar lactone lactonase YvrE
MRASASTVRLALSPLPLALAAACGASAVVPARHAASATVAAASPAAPAPSPSGALVVDGFEAPESVLHDPVADVYLVSNINGSPFARDGNGYVSRVAPDGRVLERRWITGLDAPKGSAVAGDVLAVADLTVLRRFDRRTGAARDVVAVPGAVFLNDVAAGPDGSFFVSDSALREGGHGFEGTGSDAIYRVAPDGAVTAVARGAGLEQPNGLAVAGDELLMVPLGGSTLRRFALDGTAHGASELPAGMLDGLVALPEGCVLVSSWRAPAVFAGRASGPFTALVPRTTAADIGFDARRRRLLMPLMAEGQLRIEPLRAPACE